MRSPVLTITAWFLLKSRKIHNNGALEDGFPFQTGEF